MTVLDHRPVAAAPRQRGAHRLWLAGSPDSPYCRLCQRRAFTTIARVDSVAVERALSTHWGTPASLTRAELETAILLGRSLGYTISEIVQRLMRVCEGVAPVSPTMASCERRVMRVLAAYDTVARAYHSNGKEAQK